MIKQRHRTCSVPRGGSPQGSYQVFSDKGMTMQVLDNLPTEIAEAFGRKKLT